MGDNPLEGNLTIFADGKPIGCGVVSGLDLGSESGDTAATSVWQHKQGNEFTISFTAQVNDCSSLMHFLYIEKQRRRKARKAMLHAVTHGQCVEIKVYDDNDEPVWLGMDRPSYIRRFFRATSVVPEFKVVEKRKKSD